jgi:phosphohistidine phosphatase
MDVYFLRHASAGQSKGNDKQDEKRPLDDQGIDQASLMGRVLAAMDVRFDTIVSSPLKRAIQTASLVANEIGFEQPIVQHDALRPDASFDEFQELLKSLSGKDCIMVVGHNPTQSEFLSLLVSGGGSPDGIELRKGAIAKVEIKQSRGLLQWLATPKMARTIQSASSTSSRPKTSRK